mmetsp:Transcript_47882/g.138506  ORF Transcript_47882/g.138506 Transcript_47882/m.138506 type:complete len:266 (+) Transcript_47882:126-923(+)
MSWDDEDEWDADDIEAKFEAQLKEKERQKRRDEGLDSESEEEKPKETPKADAKAKPKPKPKKKGKEKEEEPAEPEVKLSPQEEKLRQRKLVEEADARLANDLFAGCEKPNKILEQEAEEKAQQEQAEAARKAAAKPKILVVDAFEKVELKVQADVERLCATCVDKINKGQAKTAASKFLVDLLKNLENDLDLKELGELEKSLTEMVKQKQVEKGARLAKDNKANTKLSKTTKFNTASEWEEVYGGGDGDEEWSKEEWDEWYKSQK